MTGSFKFVRGVLVAGIAVAFFSASAVRADEQKGNPKGKGEQKPNILQLDLNKLPPDLAKQLQKYAAGGDEKKAQPKDQGYGKGNQPPQAQGKAKPQMQQAQGKGKPQMQQYGKGNQPQQGLGKGQPQQARGKGNLQLPPGLASKPANHPGRVAFLQNAGREKEGQNQKKPQSYQPEKKGPPAGKGPIAGKPKGKSGDE